MAGRRASPSCCRSAPSSARSATRRGVIADAWDLDGVAERLPRVHRARSAACGPKTPEAMFRAQTLLVHAWRKFPFLDPDLPGGDAAAALAAVARARPLPRAPRALARSRRRTTSARSRRWRGALRRDRRSSKSSRSASKYELQAWQRHWLVMI